MTEAHIKGWWLHGKYYGYPSCCINAFLRGEQNHDNIFVGTGFLPCNSCSKKDPDEILKIIGTNRVCAKPFIDNSPIIKAECDHNNRASDLIWKASKNVEVIYD